LDWQAADAFKSKPYRQTWRPGDDVISSYGRTCDQAKDLCRHSR